MAKSPFPGAALRRCPLPVLAPPASCGADLDAGAGVCSTPCRIATGLVLDLVGG